MNIPPEMLNQLRFGRGVDNRRYKATGFRYRLHEPRGRAEARASTCACTRSLRGAQEPYRYEREVEDFLRWSPHVKNARDQSPARGSDQPPTAAAAGTRSAPRAGCRARKRPSAAAEKATSAPRRPSGAPARGRGGRQRRAAAGTEAARSASSPVEHYDDLAAEEVIALLASLERDDLQTLRDYERRTPTARACCRRSTRCWRAAKRPFSSGFVTPANRRNRGFSDGRNAGRVPRLRRGAARRRRRSP